MSLHHPSTFTLATFPDKKKYPHFSNPSAPKCFACNSEQMLVEPRHVDDDFVLLAATMEANGEQVIIPGCWLVFPREHITRQFDMPDDWTRCIRTALAITGLDNGYNVSENWGGLAGQRIPHGHTWLINRSYAEAGLLSDGLGLASILVHVKRYGMASRR